MLLKIVKLSGLIVGKLKKKTLYIFYHKKMIYLLQLLTADDRTIIKFK